MGKHSRPETGEVDDLRHVGVDAHFRAGDEVQFGWELDALSGVVKCAALDRDGQIVVAAFGRDVRAEARDLLHRTDCAYCQALKEAGGAEDRRALTELRSEFTPAALALADGLCRAGLIPFSANGRACGSGARYLLSADAPLAPRLHAALAVQSHLVGYTKGTADDERSNR